MKLKKKEVIRKTPAFYLNYRRVTTQCGVIQWFKMSGYGFSRDKTLEQTFASEGSVDFDFTLILHVEDMKQKAGAAFCQYIPLKMVVAIVRTCALVSYLMKKSQEKRGI